MADQGRNKGLTGGVIDLAPVGGTITFPPIQCQVTGFSVTVTGTIVPITGPGAAFVEQLYGGNAGGAGTFKGTAQAAQSPFPPTMHNLQGTLTHQMSAGCSIALPVIIETLTASRAAEGNETWIVSGTWRRNGAGSLTWNGQVVTYDQPALVSSEINEGTDRTADPNSLAETATTRVFLPATANTNSTATILSTATAVNTYLAGATPPRTNLKVVTGAFTRIDDAAGILTVQWGLNDTKDQYQFPATVTYLDSHSLNSSATVGLINATNGTLSNFALRRIISKNVTPASTFNVTQFGLRTTVEDLEFPGTFTLTDPSDLRTTGKKTTVHTTASPPSDPTPPTGTQIVGKTVQNLTSAGTANSYTVWHFAKKTAAQELTLPRTRTIVDPFSLNSMSSIAAIDSTPSLQAGFKLRATVTDNPTPDHTLITRRGALKSTSDDVTFPSISSFRSAQTPYLDSTSEIVAASGTVAAQANSLWATFQSVAFALGLRVIPLTDNFRKVIYYFRNPGILVHGITTGRRQIMARMNGSNPQMYVVHNLAQGSGWRQVQFSRQWVVSAARRFSLARLITGTSIPEQSPSTINSVTLPSIGDCNSGSFLGLAAGLVLYTGISYNTNIALSGTLPFFVRYFFEEDDAGIVTGIPDRYFSTPVNLPTNASTTGWTNVSTLGITDVVAPAQSSFAAFVA